jgi:Fic family protein
MSTQNTKNTTQDNFQNRFTTRLEFNGETTRKVINLLTEIDSLRSRFSVQSHLSPQLIDRLIRSVIITSSGASTRIEGSMLGDTEVKALFGKLGVQKFNTRDEQEVAGYLELLKIVFENFKDISFTESTIKHFHSLLLKYSSKDERHKGNYKFGSNRVEAHDSSGKLLGIIFDPTPPHLVEKELREVLEFTITELEKKDFNPLLIIANFVFEYLAIHPFQDGNGRSSRVLTNLLLLQNNYTFTPFISHERIIEKNKEEYYLVLNQSQRTWKTENEDISSWIIFFLTAIKVQVTEAVNLLEKKEDMEIILSEYQLAVWNTINNSTTSLSRSEIQKISNVNVETIKQALQKLQGMNKIQAIGEGRATRYRVV